MDKVINCHSCQRSYVLHKDDIITRKTMGMKTPTNACSRKYSVCKCGVENSVKESNNGSV